MIGNFFDVAKCLKLKEEYVDETELDESRLKNEI